jgi:endo-1,4-beta-xylanase
MPAGIASDGTPRDHVGTITVDGGSYEVWKKTRTNKPSITGDNKTFDQYFSIRYEAKILVEAQDTTGTVDFTKATVVVR